MDLAQDVISPFELEDILTRLKPCPLETIGSSNWSQQMSLVEELNVQAAIEASRGSEELVRDSLIERDLLPVVIHQLLTMELWRDEILSRILQNGKPESSFQIYMALFNEVNLVNLLETILYNCSACESLGDSAVDLTDYCIRQLTYYMSSIQDDFQNEDSNGKKKLISSSDLAAELANWKPGMALPEIPVEDVDDEVKRHLKETSFQISMKSITILRYMTDHISSLPLGVTTRLVLTHDTPILFIQLMEVKPWIKRISEGSKIQVFEGSDWMDVSDDDEDRMPKIEAQVWIGLYNMFSKKQCSEKYEIHGYRRNMILKLEHHLNEMLINQLPILGDFRRWVLELSIGSQSSAPTINNLLIEAVAEIREALISRYKCRYDEISKDQSSLFLSERSSSELVAQAARLMKALDSEAVQHLTGSSERKREDDERKFCVVCRKPEAKNRCSRCHSQRYCGRGCQVKHWSKHKLDCKPSSSEKLASNQADDM